MEKCKLHTNMSQHNLCVWLGIMALLWQEFLRKSVFRAISNVKLVKIDYFIAV